MIPVLLAAVGGYLIGNSLKSKQYADGGNITDFRYKDIESGLRYNATATNIFNVKDKRRWDIVTEDGTTFYVFAYSEVGMKEAVSDEIKGSYANGGEIKPYLVWVSKDGYKREKYGEYKSKRAAEMAMKKIWQSGDYKEIGNLPKEEFEKYGYFSKGGNVTGKRYKINVYYGGEMDDEVVYADTLEEAKRIAQRGEHSEIYDLVNKEFIMAKGGNVNDDEDDDDYDEYEDDEDDDDYDDYDKVGSLKSK